MRRFSLFSTTSAVARNNRFYRSAIIRAPAGGLYSCWRHCATTTTTTAESSSEKNNTTGDVDAQKQQQEKKAAFEKLNSDGLASSPVAFACAASTELVPYVAASEAFDVACTALQAATNNKPPNFCFTVISVDHEGMIDAPQAVWRHFSSQNLPGSDNMQRLMLGCVVRNQRVGDGFIEVMLGHIPDLRYTAFTFDKVPKAVDRSFPPVAAGFAFSDWKIGAYHPLALLDRLSATSDLMRGGGDAGTPGPPLVGGVLPPAEPLPSTEKLQQQQQGGGDESSIPPEPAPSLYFVNDDVYRGSAGAVLLHSAMLEAHVMTLMPSIVVRDSVSIDDATLDQSTGVWHINKLGGKGQTACDFVRSVYETDDGLKKKERSKMFLGLSSSSSSENGSTSEPFPLSFIGNPEEGGNLTVVVPPFLRDAALTAKSLTLLRDDSAEETHAIGSDLLQYERSMLRADRGFYSTSNKVMVHRERKVDVVAANSCCLHWSHPLLYSVFKPETGNAQSGLFTVGGGSMEKHAPSIARRVLGGILPNSGLHCSGIVLPAAGPSIPTPQVMPRASTHMMLSPKKK